MGGIDDQGLFMNTESLEEIDPRDCVIEVPRHYRAKIGKMFETRVRHYAGNNTPEHTFLEAPRCFMLCAVHAPGDLGYAEIAKAVKDEWYKKVIRSSTASHDGFRKSDYSKVIFEILLGPSVYYYCVTWDKLLGPAAGDCTEGYYDILFKEMR